MRGAWSRDLLLRGRSLALRPDSMGEMKEDIYTRFCRICGVPDPATFPPPEKIPCTEFSDAEHLCKHPLVSVVMTTYNHAKWIRQAIEGVLDQKTDFEYELIIGDDASTDGTTDICREYQRKYPDKVRVLWSAENVYSISGNNRRCYWRCRGEFVALCEGDDYWTDPAKLQKQMDLIHRHDAMGCVAYNWRQESDGKRVLQASPASEILDWRTLSYYHTSTYVFKKRIFADFPDIRSWYDSVMLDIMVSSGRVCLLKEPVSVYRLTGVGDWTGATNCRQRLMDLGLHLDLYAHGPQDVPAPLYQFAKSALGRIVGLERHGDAECRRFVAEHRYELRSIFSEVWQELPLLLRLRWIRLWWRRP